MSNKYCKSKIPVVYDYFLTWKLDGKLLKFCLKNFLIRWFSYQSKIKNKSVRVEFCQVNKSCFIDFLSCFLISLFWIWKWECFYGFEFFSFIFTWKLTTKKEQILITNKTEKLKLKKISRKSKTFTSIVTGD